MSTVVKTLKLLDFLTTVNPEMGLTQFMRASGYDKATTHRRLTELVKAGFLEQDPTSKAYRLGAAIPRLAIVREQTFPEREAALRELRSLYGTLQETVHVSIVQGRDGLSTLAHIDDVSHGNRVYVEPADILPFHATASGLVVLAFSEPRFVDDVLSRPLQALTDETVTDPDRLRRKLASVAGKGFGSSESQYEPDVSSLSAPLFDRNGGCCGAVASAMPTSRFTEEKRSEVQRELAGAAVAITAAWGGDMPERVAQPWRDAGYL